jgi:hypothetical protein
LQLLQRNDPYLIEALAALLMILPQGKVFNMLKGRLEVGRLVSVSVKDKMVSENRVNIDLCLKEFMDSQVALQRGSS